MISSKPVYEVNLTNLLLTPHVRQGGFFRRACIDKRKLQLIQRLKPPTIPTTIQTIGSLDMAPPEKQYTMLVVYCKDGGGGLPAGRQGFGYNRGIFKIRSVRALSLYNKLVLFLIRKSIVP